MDIEEVTGLESSELQISTSDNALIDGATVDGKKIKPRPIHIVASYRSTKNNPENRKALIKFFNPKYTGLAKFTSLGTTRKIDYELEGWAFNAQANLDMKLKIVVDLICPDPYMQNIDNFGKNMANITPLWAFPWRVTRTRLTNKKDYPEEYRGMMLGSITTGYRTLHKEVVLANDGDVSTGLQIQFVATRGPATNPMIKNTGTGQFMRVVVELEKGDILLIDTNDTHQVITLNGVNCYQKVDRHSEPFQIAVGDNYLEYDADENYTNLDVNLYYTPKYLGV
jgi:hypothetical protein